MTTIAWDGKTLAVESRSTADEAITNNTTQKLFLNVGDFKAVAFTGKVADIAIGTEWLENGQRDPMPMGEGSMICVDGKNKLTIFYLSSQVSEQITGSYADGSGWKFATGALDNGATAIEAVKIACKRDIYSGGRVRSYTFKSEVIT